MVLSLFRITAHFLKLSKACLCCVHSATRHDQLFSVSFNSEPISKAFQSLPMLCGCYKQTWLIVHHLISKITANFWSFPKFVLVVSMLLADRASCSQSSLNYSSFSSLGGFIHQETRRFSPGGVSHFFFNAPGAHEFLLVFLFPGVMRFPSTTWKKS